MARTKKDYRGYAQDIQTGQTLGSWAANDRAAARNTPANIQAQQNEGLRRATDRDRTRKIESAASAYTTQRGMMASTEKAYDRLAAKKPSQSQNMRSLLKIK